MKAPEKIYLQEPTKVRTEKVYDNDIEYTRTDAFIEKVCEWLLSNAHKYQMYDAIEDNEWYDKKQLILDFKKAMEEEK